MLRVWGCILRLDRKGCITPCAWCLGIWKGIRWVHLGCGCVGGFLVLPSNGCELRSCNAVSIAIQVRPKYRRFLDTELSLPAHLGTSALAFPPADPLGCVWPTVGVPTRPVGAPAGANAEGWGESKYLSTYQAFKMLKGRFLEVLCGIGNLQARVCDAFLGGRDTFQCCRRYLRG